MQESRGLKALLSAWAKAVAGTDLPQPPAYAGPDVTLTFLSEKSGEITSGAGFVARVRETSDGHPYIGDAVARGASLIVAQRPLDEVGMELPDNVAYLQAADTAVAMAWLSAAWQAFPSRDLVMIGITGTDGKTTTANILLAMLRAAGYRCGLLSTTRAVIGEEEEPLALHVTTPEAPVVQQHLRRMVDAGLTHCILETTSHGLAQHRVGAIDFDVAAVTNITHEHLDYHGGYEAYTAAKALLFATLSTDPWQVPSHNPYKNALVKTAILNRDDTSYTRLSQENAPRQVAYALQRTADLRARDIEYAANETRFTLHGQNLAWPQAPATIDVISPLSGEFNVYNVTAAAAGALVVGAPADAITRGLEQMEAIDGRMERIEAGQPYTVIVDFAHTPNALIQVLQAARAMTAGRIIVVFGSAGKRDVEKRRAMAEIAARRADLTVLTAEDPRTDSLKDILQTMAEGMMAEGGIEETTFWRIPDRGSAIYYALSLAEPGDLVLICGKGHEQSMCFGTIEYPWDDRSATREALAALASGDSMPDLGLPTFKA